MDNEEICNVGENEGWSSSRIKLLIKTHLELEKDFAGGKQSRSVLWRRILTEMKKTVTDLPLKVDSIKAKFYNLYTTYKRVKQRHNSSGRGRTNWAYYELFDDVYGTKHSVQPPENITCSTFKGNSKTVSTSFLDKTDDDGLDIEIDDNETQSEVRNKNKRKKRDENILEYLKEQAKEDKKRHTEFLELEHKKLEIEETRVKILQEMLEVFQSLISELRK